MITEKTCTKCGELKPLSFYSFNKRTSDRKPAKEPAFVEYPIVDCHGGYKCEVNHARDCLLNLTDLANLVGFAGVAFSEGGNTWHMNICALVDEFGAFTDYENVNGDRTKPATPIAARFYIKESK